MLAFSLVSIQSQLRPIFDHISSESSLPASTPMEPVMVLGWATILSAAMATK